jgi:hypothetical protein
VGGFDISVSFFAGIVSPTGATYGPYLGDALSSLSLTDLSVSGQAHLFEVSLLPSGSLDTLQDPAKSSGFVLATLSFDAVGLGTSPLDFSNVALTDANANPIVPVITNAGSITVVPEEEPSFLWYMAALLAFFSCRRNWSHLVAAVAGLVIVGPAAAQAPPPIKAYTDACYAALKIKAGDFPTDLDCMVASKSGSTVYQLQVRQDGTVKDLKINGVKNPKQYPPGSTPMFPASCDTPSWLELQSNRCYGNTFLQRFTIGTDVKGAILCRQKKRWVYEDKFEDIAMFLYSTKTGNTCWYNTPDTTPRDGSKIVPPEADTGTYWGTPTFVAGVNCIRCHDNGPNMNSPWLNNDSNNKLKDTYTNLPAYHSVGVGDAASPFQKWKEPVFIDIGIKGLEGKPKAVQNGQCNRCHRIASKLETDPALPGSSNGTGRNFQNYDNWMDFTTGRKFPAMANATGKSFTVAYWMPLGHTATTPAEWNASYKAHYDKVKACAAAGGMGIADCDQEPNPTIVAALAPSITPGVHLLASADNGVTYPFSSDAPSDGTDLVCGMDTPDCNSIWVKWSADANFSGCLIDATFPAGVTVGPYQIHTGSNWGLSDPPQDIGSLSAPGDYRFGISCDEDTYASITFHVNGTPQPYLSIQAIVNGAAGPAATLGTTPTSTTAHLLDEVALYWATENVSGTCMVTESFSPPPLGVVPKTWQDVSGFQLLQLKGGTTQTYTLTCGAQSVQTSIVVASLKVCDVNGDGKVDISDIQLISAAAGQSATPYDDPRDANNDGLITVDDARACVLKCDKAGCAP